MSKFSGLYNRVGQLGRDAKNGRVSLVPITQECHPDELEAALPGANHAMVAFWHRDLPDERSLMFWGDNELILAQRIRADLLHQVFPRAILLMERHRRATANHHNFSSLCVRVIDKPEWQPADGIHISREGQWDKGQHAGFAISQGCWAKLLPLNFHETFEQTINVLKSAIHDSPNNYEHNWHHVVDAGRSLRMEYEDQLRFCRHHIADSRNDQITAIDVLKLISGRMCDWNQVWQYRCNKYGDQILKDKMGYNPDDDFAVDELFNTIDIDVIDDFLCLLQSIRCYMNNDNQLVSWMWRGEDDRATGILASFKNVTDIPSIVMDDLTYLNMHFGNGMAAPISNNGVHDDRQNQTALPSQITKLIKDWIRKSVEICVDSGPTLKQDCALRIIDIARNLAEKHSVHEGRPLKYRFVYAASASLWTEIEDTLSFDTNSSGNSYSVIAEKIAAHWSIFQPERVFGLVDTLALGNFQGHPRIQRVVRVRPPLIWSGLESEAMENLAIQSNTGLVVVVLRPGVIRLTLSTAKSLWKTCLWDIRKGQIEIFDAMGQGRELPSAHYEARKLLEGLCFTDEALRPRIEATLASVLAEISEAEGEGALLIATGDDKARQLVEKFCVQMDETENQMAWRKEKRLEWMDRTLLRAMFILDGGTILETQEDKSIKLSPRMVAYPHTECPVQDHGVRSYTVMRDIPDKPEGCTCQPASRELLERLRKRLLGKGSRTHGAANIAILLDNDSDHYRVLSISADGGLTPWVIRDET